MTCSLRMKLDYRIGDIAPGGTAWCNAGRQPGAIFVVTRKRKPRLHSNLGFLFPKAHGTRSMDVIYYTLFSIRSPMPWASSLAVRSAARHAVIHFGRIDRFDRRGSHSTWAPS